MFTTRNDLNKYNEQFSRADFSALSQHADHIFNRIIGLTNDCRPKIAQTDTSRAQNIRDLLPLLLVNLDSLEVELNNAWDLDPGKKLHTRLDEIKDGIDASYRIIYTVEQRIDSLESKQEQVSNVESAQISSIQTITSHPIETNESLFLPQTEPTADNLSIGKIEDILDKVFEK